MEDRKIGSSFKTQNHRSYIHSIEHARRLQGCGKINFAIENSDLPPSDAPVIYRPARNGWIVVALTFVFIAAIFAIACLPLLNLGEFSTEEIAEKHIESNTPFVWLSFGSGALMSLLWVAQILSMLLHRVIADEDGLRWRSFLSWKSARWDEITDCLMVDRSRTGRVVMDKRRLALETHNPAWPALRDFIAARVALPGDLEAWHLPLDDETRRAQSATADDGAPIKTTPKTWPLAIVGCVYITIIGVMFGYVFDKNPTLRFLIGGIVALVAAILVVYPLLEQWRGYILADDEGVLIAEITRRRRIRWEQIEDMFLLRSRQPKQAAAVFIVVAGHSIHLNRLGKQRDAILNRIEARAYNSRSRQLQPRDLVPLGNRLPLPTTFDATAGMRRWKARNALFLLGFSAITALSVLSIKNVGWQNFDWSRGIIVFVAAIASLVFVVWARRVRQRLASWRIRATPRIWADEAGLALEARDVLARTEWAQIARLEHDCGVSIWDDIYRVESADGAVIEWDETLPRNDLLAHLLVERSGLEWEISARYRHKFVGLRREGEALQVSENNALTQLRASVCLALWGFIPLMQLCVAYFDEEYSLARWLSDFWVWLVPPLGLALWAALAILLSMARVRTRCDARQLTHRSWFGTRAMNWEDVSEIGTDRVGLYDFVRARSGQTIRLWLLPMFKPTSARRELRKEIMRRAPGVAGTWKSAE